MNSVMPGAHHTRREEAIVLDRLAQLAHVAALAIACLCVGEQVTVGPVEVRRSSLLGYEVAGQVWEAQDAARAAAHEASMQASDDASPEPRPTAARPPGRLLKAPHKSLGRIAEVWTEGALCDARLRALRAGPLAPYVEERATTLRSFHGHRREVVITYPAGFAVPAIEVVS